MMNKIICTVLFMIGINQLALAGQNKLVVPTLTSMYGKAKLPISIENTDEIVAMQFDLTLPEGITPVGDAILTSRCDDHSVTILSIASRVYRILLYSDHNRPLAGQSGVVFYLPINISEDIPADSELTLTIDEPVLSKVTGENMLTDTEVGTIYVKSIPFPEIVNPGFEQSEAVTANLNVSSSIGGIDYVTSGWELYQNGRYANSGVFTYGSDFTINNVHVPSLDNEGDAGHALGISTGWNYSLIYRSAEPVLVPRGTYALLAYVYNANPDAEQISSRLGFITTEGKSYISAITSYTAGEWTIDYVVFTLSSCAEGFFQVGCSSQYVSPSRNAIPFFDNLLLTNEQDLTARMIDIQMNHFPEDYGEGKAMASLIVEYKDARQQIAAATNIQDVMSAAKTTQQKYTAIKEYISAMDNLTQAVQEVESCNLSQATLNEARTMLSGLIEGTLYTNEQISQMKSDVNNMISRLSTSVSLYRQLNSAVTNLTSVLETAGPDTRLGLADEINIATELVSTNKTGHDEGTIADTDIQGIYNQLQEISEELSNNIANYVDSNEWQILKTVYEQRNEVENWTRIWDFSRGKPWKSDVPGVDINDGHVVGLNLNNNNMAGEVPFSLLELPKLQSLNFYGNRFTSLSNAIPANVTSLNLGKQTMDYVADLNLHEILTGSMTAKLPSILLYNHNSQSFDAPLKLKCTDEDGNWSMEVNKQSDGNVNISSVSPYVYKWANGAMLNVRNTYDSSTFNIKFSFDQGDSNFDGFVNIYDLQSTINYAFDDYNNKPFNFTAANLWVDELINVQDVVRMVDVLMKLDDEDDDGSSINDQNPSRFINHPSPSIKAMFYIQDGYLMLKTNVPVAAFDLTLNTITDITFAKTLKGLGITYSMEYKPSGIRIIGYSLSGGVLPEGQTTICKVDASTTIVRALLSDAEAMPVSVAFNNGHTTGIMDIEGGKKNAEEVYDLQGRRINTLHPESNDHRPKIVIQNGRKIIK